MRCPLLVGVAVAAIVATAAGEVAVLTKDNFKPLVLDATSGVGWIVDFYAPWCGHCKKLEPELDAAAAQLRGKTEVKFGKVDCTVEKDLAKEYNIQGYPTIKFFRDGSASEYQHGRGKDDLVEFAKTMSKPAVQPLKALSSSHASDPYFVYSGDIASPAYKLFTKVARQFQARNLSFFSSESNQHPALMTRVMLGAKDISTPVDPSSALADLVAWVDGNKRPYLSELGLQNFRELVTQPVRLVMAALDPTDKGFADMKKKLHDVAVSHDGQLVFSWIDSTRWNHWLQKQFNIDGKKPAMVVYDYNSERHWPAKDGTLATAESITKFLKDVADNKIEFVGPSVYNPAYVLRQFVQNFTLTPTAALKVIGCVTAVITTVWVVIIIFKRVLPQKSKAQGKEE
ncbi:Thioredoxin domain-containing protein [Plasmodiophora brassicae]